MKCFRYAVLCVSAGLIAAACGGSSEGGKKSGPVAEEELPQLLVKAICDIRDCCEAQGQAYDQTGCEARYSQQLDGLFATGPNTRYDEVAAGECLDAVRAMADSCGETAPDDANACARVVTGSLAPGQACGSSSECAAPQGGDAYCDGVCIQVPRASQGEPCDATCEETPGFIGCSSGPTSTEPGECYRNDGLYCSPEGRCAALGQVGEPCASDDGCEAAAHCENAVCMADRAEGAPCGWSGDCEADFHCSEATGICTKALALGQSCAQHDACGSAGKCQGGVCVRAYFPRPEDCRGDVGDTQN